MRSELHLRGMGRRTARAAWQASAGVAALLAVAWVAAACSDQSVVDPPVAAVASDAAPNAMAMAQASDRDFLVALYEATDGPNWRDNTNWLSDRLLGEWYGVDTDASGRVTALRLFDNRLAGPIPRELSKLTALRQLDLRYNSLTGPLPAELGGLANLRVLLLSTNRLSGAIPPELGNLANLWWLALGVNQLSGAIPPELGNLANLAYLDLGYSGFFGGGGLSGAIPRELGGLANLLSLDLGRNKLTGTIPLELGGLANLESLHLYENQLSGTIPLELGGLANLESLHLYENQLSGTVPLSFLQLTRLERFGFADNAGLCLPDPLLMWYEALHTQDGPICPDRDVLAALYESAGGTGWTSSAGWLDDDALGEWHGVEVDSAGLVSTIDLAGNGLSGGLTERLGDLAGLTALRIADNDLAGRLPPSLTLTPLRELHYANTDLCAPADRSFQEWLAALAEHTGTGLQCAPPPDREILKALYERTDGANWETSRDWLTDAPLGTWHGVEANAAGQVRSLVLSRNRLEGTIPPELGGLAELETLALSENNLTGPIPPELGALAELETLALSENNLTGPIPPELGQLRNLRVLSLGSNQLASVPREIGRLAKLEYLELTHSELTSAPRELGQLGNLEKLYLDYNRLASVPPELGRLDNLLILSLGSNELTSIPAELGALNNLGALGLYENRLTAVPISLGGLASLQVLDLSSNELTGSVPAGLLELTELTSLSLAENTGMTGALPLQLTAFERLDDLHTTGTGLCAPADPEFLDWIDGVTRQRVALCDRDGGAAAYLTQAVQSRDFPVPLVAGEPALLRVFVTADGTTGAGMPPVRVTFYRDGAVTHVAEIPGTSNRIPSSIDESSLSNSVNVEIPGRVIQPGLQVVIEPDPDGTLDPALGVARRIPAAGRMAVDVRAMPVFEVTLVPFVWQASPNSSIIATVDAMAADPAGHELFERTHLLLPVSEIDATAHEPVTTSTNNAYDLLYQVEMMRVAEGGRGHYLALMAPPTTGGVAGVGHLPGWSSFSGLDAGVIAHEFGHNRGLYHAPCGGAGGPDRYYPYGEGNIGAWGYDFGTGSLVPPGRADFMSYCGPTWTSDYHFTSAVRYRLETETGSVLIATDAARTASGRALMLWGGLDGEGAPRLRPSFFIDAPPVLPEADGPWRITGEDPVGAPLFSLSFAMAEFADTDGEHAGFSFAVPVTWTEELARITLQGPEGSALLDRDTDLPMTILRDPATRRIRGILEGPPTQAAPSSAAPAAARAAQDLHVIFSRGIPDPADARR